MLKPRQLGLVIFGCIALNFSCAKKQYDGEGYKNYPDMNMILAESITPMKDDLLTYKLVTTSPTSSDTSYIPSSKVDWKYFEQAFLKQNMHDPKFDRKFKMSLVTDTDLHIMTYQYTPLDPSMELKRVNIMSSETEDHAIKSIYIETMDDGFFSSYGQKLLLVPGKSLQIQEASKKPFQK